MRVGTRANDPWLFGYWHFLWADATIKIGKIDTEAKTITTAEPYHYGGRGMSNTQGIIYYAFNLLEEIDQPGEWYLDREAGILYLPRRRPEPGHHRDRYAREPRHLSRMSAMCAWKVSPLISAPAASSENCSTA